jgi:hypothetical protein
MVNSSIRRPILAWLAACVLAAPAFAQTRVAASAEGFSAPAVPAAGFGAAAMGSNGVVAPISLSAPSLFAAPSAPAASVSRPVALSAAFSAPALAAAPVLPAASIPRAAPASVAIERAAAPFAAATHPAAHAVFDSARPRQEEAAASPVGDVRPDGAREAAAAAMVKDIVAGWTARAPQTLDGTPVAAAASEGSEPLDRSSTRAPAASPAPAVPAPSKFRNLIGWAGPILALAALITGIDAGTKMYALKHMFSVFHECAWRTPILEAIIPYIMFTAYKARSGLPNDRKVRQWSPLKIGNGHWGFYSDELSGMNTMIKDHPSLRTAVRIYDVAIGLMIGGMLGNGIDAVRLGGALDWIPLGRSLMNFADVALLCGLALFQVATGFFIKAAIAHKIRKPLDFNTVYFLGLPLLGVFIAWAFGSAEGKGALDLAMKNVGFIYLMGFSMLVGTSRFLAAAVTNRFVSKFVAEEAVRVAQPQKP